MLHSLHYIYSSHSRKNVFKSRFNYGHFLFLITYISNSKKVLLPRYTSRCSSCYFIIVFLLINSWFILRESLDPCYWSMSNALFANESLLSWVFELIKQLGKYWFRNQFEWFVLFTHIMYNLKQGHSVSNQPNQLWILLMYFLKKDRHV